MKIAIIGSGISGLTAAHMLNPHHDITVFEANDYIGGHTHTVEVESGGQYYQVDTGFIVFNHKTYPNFTKLLDKLDVASQLSHMSFSVKCEQTGLEYNGTSLNTLFAQRRNFVSPKFWRMIRDILRFNEDVKELLNNGLIDPCQSLGSYLKRNGYGQTFVDYYILPMGSAIWSASKQQMLLFPLQFFATFFNNHGMLNVNDRPQWRVVRGGSKSYVDVLTRPFRDRILLIMPVQQVKRHPGFVEITTVNGCHHFDEVILAVHSDQALKMLADPSKAETDVLGAIKYQENETILHTDASVLPKRPLAWAAWNYHMLDQQGGRVAVTYNMNILQSLKAADTFCVTLNHTEAINPDKIIDRYVYHHPLFSQEAVEAQQKHDQISGVNRTHFCGAYWFYGFHEDGLRSGKRVAEQILKKPHIEAVPA